MGAFRVVVASPRRDETARQHHPSHFLVYLRQSSHLLQTLATTARIIMARTKQTARKSAGVKPPRKQLSSSTFKPWTIIDHTGNKIAFSRKTSYREFGFFPFQVYILATAASLATNIDFPDRLRDYIIANNGSIRFNENCDWRLEIFSVPQISILDCVKHHEQEKRYRNR